MGICQSTQTTVQPSVEPATGDGRFVYKQGKCALEYWEPIKELSEGSISSIHLVKRRTNRIDVPCKERADSESMGDKKSDKNDADDADDEIHMPSRASSRSMSEASAF